MKKTFIVAIEMDDPDDYWTEEMLFDAIERYDPDWVFPGVISVTEQE